MYKNTENLICLSLENGNEITKETKELDTQTGQLMQAIYLADKYSNVIFRMPKFAHPEITNLTNIQQLLKDQVSFWVGTIKLELGECISHLRSFYALFNTTYKFIKQKINAISDSKNFILNYLGRLINAGNKISLSMQTIARNIQIFSTQTQNNRDKLSNTNRMIETLLQKNHVKLAPLNKDLEALESQIKLLERQLIASSFFSGLGGLGILIGIGMMATLFIPGPNALVAVAGVAVLAGGIITTVPSGIYTKKYNEQLQATRVEKNNKLFELKKIKDDTVHLSNIKTNFIELLSMGNEVVQVFKNIHAGWSTINTILEKVLEKARKLHNDVKKDDSSFLSLNLDQLNSEFETLYLNAKKYEQAFSLPIQDQSQTGVKNTKLIPNLALPFVAQEIFYASKNLNKAFIQV